MRSLLAIVFSLMFAACGAGSGDDGVDQNALTILGMNAPEPVLPGTILGLSARGLTDVGSTALVLARGDRIVVIPAAASDGFEAQFPIDENAFSVFGIGEHVLSVRVRSGGDESPAWSWIVTFSDNVPARIDRMPAGTVSWGQELVVSGGGFLYPSEGTSRLAIEGSFRREDGSTVPVTTSYELVPIESSNRDRAGFRFEPNFGPTDAGELRGTAQVRNVLTGGQNGQSNEVTVALDVRPASVLDISPREYSVGQVFEIVGTGFVSPSQGSIAVTLVGTLTGDQGAVAIDVELEPVWINDGRLRITSDPIVDEAEGVLIDSWFAREWGTFEGELIVTIDSGPEVYSTVPLLISLELERQRQVVVLEYLRGFDSSLDRFGLGSASDEVRAAVRSRVRGIFEGLRVDILDEAPSDISPNVVSVVEVGGPDPNGLGLLGYDSSPGKDVGNLRLGDRIGGASAETQSDGAAGYGGVFIESYLYWSSDPGFGGSRPEGAPFEDPLFDPIFDPLRESQATLQEVNGDSLDPQRVAIVAEAIRALGSVIGETVAHEVGHSLGLADPLGPATSFHNAFGEDGCLMDGGVDRPLGERAGLPAFAATHFCGDSASYLSDLLGE